MTWLQMYLLKVEAFLCILFCSFVSDFLYSPMKLTVTHLLSYDENENTEISDGRDEIIQDEGMLFGI